MADVAPSPIIVSVEIRAYITLMLPLSCYIEYYKKLYCVNILLPKITWLTVLDCVNLFVIEKVLSEKYLIQRSSWLNWMKLIGFGAANGKGWKSPLFLSNRDGSPGFGLDNSGYGFCGSISRETSCDREESDLRQIKLSSELKMKHPPSPVWLWCACFFSYRWALTH